MLDEQGLFLFERLDAGLVGADHARALGGDDAVEEAGNLALHRRDLPAGLGGAALEGLGAHVPGVGEHRGGELHQRLRGNETREQGFEVALDVFALDGLAVEIAALGVAEIVGFRAAPGPAGGEGLLAGGAADEAAQREVGIEILAMGGLGLGGLPLLQAGPGGQIDQRLMLARDHVQAPGRIVDVAGIDRPREQFCHALGVDLAAMALREGIGGVGPDEAIHLGRGFETARGEAFEGLLQQRGDGLVAHQQLAVPPLALEPVAGRRLEAPIAVHHPRAHAVAGLIGVLLALMLGDGGEQVLDEDRVGILAELDRGAFQLAAGLGEGGAQLEMGFEPSGEARDVVDDDDRRAAAVLAQPGEHVVHAGALGRFAGHVVPEDGGDLIVAIAGILAAAGFLGGEAVALDDLPGP